MWTPPKKSVFLAQVGPTSDMVEKGPPVPEDWVGKQRCLARNKSDEVLALDGNSLEGSGGSDSKWNLLPSKGV